MAKGAARRAGVTLNTRVGHLIVGSTARSPFPPASAASPRARSPRATSTGYPSACRSSPARMPIAPPRCRPHVRAAPPLAAGGARRALLRPDARRSRCPNEQTCWSNLCSMQCPFTVTPPGDTRSMQRQLLLIERELDWKLDERTKAIGRRGIERARAALQQARAARHDAQLETPPAPAPAHERPAAA